MNKPLKILFGLFILIVLTLSLVSAMSVKSIDANNFQPGSEQKISVDVKNNLDNDAKDVSLSLDMKNLPFTIVNYDYGAIDIDSSDTESFDFMIKASNSAEAGDYQIPYTLSYSINGTAQTSKNGTFILTIEAEPELSYSISTETPIVGSQGKIKLTIVNKGLGDAKFVSILLIPEGYTLLSEENNYIGTISSDDSETVSMDVIFKQQNPTFTAQIEYKDFDNQKVTKTVTLPVTVYSQEEALQMGIIKQNNTFVYVIVGAVLFVIWMIVRKIRKKRRMNKAQGG